MSEVKPRPHPRPIAPAPRASRPARRPRPVPAPRRETPSSPTTGEPAVRARHEMCLNRLTRRRVEQAIGVLGEPFGVWTGRAGRPASFPRDRWALVQRHPVAPVPPVSAGGGRSCRHRRSVHGDFHGRWYHQIQRDPRTVENVLYRRRIDAFRLEPLTQRPEQLLLRGDTTPSDSSRSVAAMSAMRSPVLELQQENQLILLFEPRHHTA